MATRILRKRCSRDSKARLETWNIDDVTPGMASFELRDRNCM